MKKILGDTRLMLKCCVMYYENEMGQNEIAQKLGISRPTVSKLLKEGKRISKNRNCRATRTKLL